MTEDQSLYNRVRPSKVSDLVGQDEAVQSLTALLKKKLTTKAFLITGPSGVGKTTIAYILRDHLKCHAESDYNIYNAADKGGIDTIRTVIDNIRWKPLSKGGNRLWHFEECHKLTPDAQDTLLVPLEHPPPNVYFILSTTDPQKVKTAIKTRCTPINLKPIAESVLTKLVQKTAKAEGAKLHESVAKKIAECAQGSARMALVLLEQAIPVKGTSAKMAILEKSDAAGPAFDLCKAMFGWENAGRTDWPRAAKVLDQLKKEGSDQQIEGLRQMVLSTCANVMLKGGPAAGRALEIYSLFEFDFYSTRINGLIAAVFRACNTGRK